MKQQKKNVLFTTMSKTDPLSIKEKIIDNLKLSEISYT